MVDPFALGDGGDVWRIAIASASFLLALAYLPWTQDAPGSLARTALKTSVFSVLALLPLMYLGLPGANTGILAGLTVALALSALGDFFLALPDQRRWFVPGLAAFLAAHLAYIAVLWPLVEFPGPGALTAIALVLLATGLFLARLYSALGSMRVPVLAYTAVILIMVAAALSVPDVGILGLGAVLFAVSDGMIAQRKFAGPFPGAGLLVWTTYCAAQFMIAWALIARALQE